MKTIQEEITDLTAEAKRLDWEARSPRACPRAAWEAGVKHRVTLERIAGLRVLTEELRSAGLQPAPEDEETVAMGRAEDSQSN